MAKLTGIVRMQGTVGNITFAKGKRGMIIVKEKSAISAERIATDPAFARTRENNREFATAGRAGRLLYGALRSAVYKAADKGVYNRLTGLMLKIIKADMVNNRGDRNVIDGGLGAVKGFEFNAECKLGSTFFVPFSTEVDEDMGQMKVVLPVYVPEDSVLMPVGSTHFRLIAAGAEINYSTEEVVLVDVKKTAYLAGNAEPTTTTTLTCQLTAETTSPLFLAVGIEFFQQVNGEFYPFKDGSFNAFQVVKVRA